MGRGLSNLENVAAYRPPSEIFSRTFHPSRPGPRRHRFHYHRRRELSSRENSAIPRCRACFNLRDLRLSRAYENRSNKKRTRLLRSAIRLKKTFKDTRRNLCRLEEFCVKNMFWRINEKELSSFFTFWYRKNANSLIKDSGIIVNNLICYILNVLSFITPLVLSLH